ncbi:methylmalonyl-CoA carboxyltransferase [Protofrankia coriariae]|uniref:Methylmalonyl-CoA carboxyltransferase n=1 Tax=Protofrankia coriariae TaxID=1562887 RepID=A0ABR5F6T7_9ACTN|nr:acyl-CoA carboxylase subunit beta [Protofrankia coriariae]KLL12390.1 methylmalonyl-CoA carboxyltransferase [Protofrankia coriariae]
MVSVLRNSPDGEESTVEPAAYWALPNQLIPDQGNRRPISRDSDGISSEAARESEPLTLEQHTALLARRRLLAEQGDDPEATRRHHARGKLTARERIEQLLDADSFTELDLFAQHRATGFGMERSHPSGDGVVTGFGTVDGRSVVVFAHDARVRGGALGETFAAKIHQVLDLAESIGAPVIGLNDGGGARIQEGVAALAGFGGLFARNVRLSGVVPQISVVLGSCAGGAVYSPALTDFIFMTRDTANMFITGPDVVRSVTGEDVSQAELGGAQVHAERTGVASFLADDEETCLDEVRYLLSFLPSNNNEAPPVVASSDDPDRRCPELLRIVPPNERTPYDIRAVIEEIVDDGEYLEVQAHWARNIVCVLARFDGRVVGIVGNQPMVLAGVLDIDASEKAARFVRMCDAYNIPLVTLVDVPGFLPGVDQEHNAIIRRGAKLLYAYCEATVPRIQVILRKAFGGAYIVMDSKSIGSDLSFAWPVNQTAVMGADGAANIIFRKELAAADDPDQLRAELTKKYSDALLHPYAAAERGHVDDVIDPADTRRMIVRGLAFLRTKRHVQQIRKHPNEPL